MTRSENRSRLKRLEAIATETANDDGSAATFLRSLLTTTAASLIAQGILWETFPKADHVAAAVSVERAEYHLAAVMEWAQAVVDGAPMVHWQQTAEQAYASRRHLADQVEAARLCVTLAKSPQATASADTREPDSHLREPDVPHSIPHPGQIPVASHVALAGTSGTDPTSNERSHCHAPS